MGKGFGSEKPKKGNKKRQVKLPPFLGEVLWASGRSNGDPQVVYPLLQANLHKLNENFVQQFRNWADAALPNAKPEAAQIITLNIINFSTLLGQFPLGNRAINLEIALTGYEVAATVFPRKVFPAQWALIQQNLAPVYRHRIKGEHAENLEKAITACEGAFQVYTRDAFPEKWAGVKNNLGLVYTDRIRGDLAENQEKAIACYEAALQVYTREAIPEEWGRVQNNLGIAYYKRIQGNLAENQEKAIACYEAALKVRTREALPDKWAQTQNNLGLIYSERILGDPIQNVEKAITCYKAALQVQTPEAFPAESASVQIQLADACRHRDDLYQGGKELHFLLQIFQAIRNNRQNLQAVYPLLSANLDKLDDNFIQSFDIWTTVKLSTVDRKEAEIRAVDIVLFSGLIQQFPLGDRAINLEIAIKGYEIVSEIFSQQDNFLGKQLWADTLCDFSWAYTNRIRGNRAENLEKAISVCKQALTIDSREEFPQLWASIQNNLGGAYSNRILGRKGDNLEEAIRHFKAALEVFTREAMPSAWAMLQSNLGNAYLNRIMGDRAENLEVAIKYIEAALEVYTKEMFPKEWANTQNTLAVTYQERIRGDHAENLEKAIAYLDNSLQFLTREAFPHDWAQTQMNLANAYRDQVRGNPVKNLEKAIAYYQAALQVYAQQAFPELWARAQNNLGMAYFKRIYDAEYQERAIAAFEAALQVFTREAFPQDWAMVQKNLGIIYSERISGNQAENLERAMTVYQAAFQVFTRDAFPYYWAKNQNNLAIAYTNRGQIDEAITCCRLALEVFTPTAFPVECFVAARQFGEIAAKAKRWAEAIEGYGLAIEAVETSRAWATSESRRQEIVAKAFYVYHNIVLCCINAGQLEKAIEYVERSRSKRLVDLMASNDLYQSGEIPPEVKDLLQQYEDLQQQIDQERSQNNSSNNRELMGVGNSTHRAAFQAYNEAIASLEAEKQQIWEQLRRLDPVLAGEIQVSAPDFSAMQKLIDQPTTAILSFYTTSNDTHIFVLRQNRITLHTCTGQGIETLQSWISQNWLKPYIEDGNAWKSQISVFLSELAQRLQINDLISQHLGDITEVILVPHLALHQIPLAALPIGNGQYLGDKFLIRYTPSCQVLEFCKERGEVRDQLTYGTVEDATEDLPFASFEGEQIAQLYNIPESDRLKGRRQCTKSNYRQLASRVQVLHSCHHAQSRLDEPLESILQLAGETITLGELLTPGWRLRNLSDVFLSCCETGLGVPESLTDDILTLSTGFLCAGARNIVSSLWSVDDIATALFSIFYYQHRYQGKSRPEALRQAQIELRQLNKEELLNREDIKELSRQAETGRKEARNKRSQYESGSADYLKWDREYRKYASVTNQIHSVKNSQDKEPFSHPRYWAAFTCSGLR